MPEAGPDADIAVSVVVPVFNGVAYLDQMLASLLSQSDPSFEVIAIDDGSTDDSPARLREWSARDPRLRVLGTENRGPGAARNLGLRHARGQWIAFADCDDWLSPSTLNTWRARAEHQQLDLLIGNGFAFRNDPREPPVEILLSRQPWDQVISGRDWLIHSIGADTWFPVVWLQLVSRRLWLESRARFPEGRLHEDVLWSLQLALAARRVGFVETPLYGYRLHPKSIMGSSTRDALARRVDGYLDFIPKLVAAARQRREDRALSRALSRQAFREGANLVGMIRKKAPDAQVRAALSARVLENRIPTIMQGGACSLVDHWRSVRDRYLLRRYAFAGRLR